MRCKDYLESAECFERLSLSGETEQTLRRDYLFMIVQGINIVAIVTTIVAVRRSNNICPHHLRTAQAGSSI